MEDLYTRKVVGWSMSARMTSDLVTDALRPARPVPACGRIHQRSCRAPTRFPASRTNRHWRMAVGRELPEPGLTAHSDRGSQYAGGAYQSLLSAHGITCSMSRRGNCYDNAPMESFFATLKKERVHLARYRTRAEARSDLFDYIESFYNRARRHSALGHVSPVEFAKAA